MTVRAKFKCTVVSHNYTDNAMVVKFQAVTAETEENKTWSKWTPTGSLEMYVSNPEVFNQFEEGKEYFLDITPVE